LRLYTVNPKVLRRLRN